MATQQLRALATMLPENENERREIYLAARDLMLQTESKWDTQHRLLYAHFSSAAIQIGTDLGIFRLLAKRPVREWSVTELSSETGGEHDLVSRIMRALAAYKMLDQVSTASYKATNITEILALESSEKTIGLHWKMETPWIHALPQFLIREGYKNPDDSSDTAFHMAMNTNMSQFEWIQTHPDFAKAVFDFMPLQRLDQVSWMDQPDLISLKDFEISEDDIQKGRPMFVDVGGGAGHQCIALRARRPELKGRVMFQDIDAMTIPASANPKLEELSIEVQTHNFNDPQPTNARRAKVYYLRTVLHDWPDKICGHILKQLRDAMADDSVIVIDEAVAPEVGASVKIVNYDIIMMAFLNAKERTEAQWRELLEQNGLRMRDVVCYDEEAGDSLIFVVKE